MQFKRITLDAKKKPPFQQNVPADKAYGVQLRKIAKIVGGIVNTYVDGDTITNIEKLKAALIGYSEALEPWAIRTANEMINRTISHNTKAFSAISGQISKELKSGLSQSLVGQTARQLQAEQVTLIKSLPIEAGERAQKLAIEASMGGRRPDEIAQELLRTEEVTKSRATLIARTETAKANSVITQARAQSVQSKGYIWRTAGDSDVRESHAEMEGVYVDWDKPPTLSDGTTTHAGQIFNCRCFPEPVLPEITEE